MHRTFSRLLDQPRTSDAVFHSAGFRPASHLPYYRFMNDRWKTWGAINEVNVLRCSSWRWFDPALSSRCIRPMRYRRDKIYARSCRLLGLRSIARAHKYYQLNRWKYSHTSCRWKCNRNKETTLLVQKKAWKNLDLQLWYWALRFTYFMRCI